MVNAIVCRNCQVLQTVSRLKASPGLCLKAVGLSVVGKDELDAGHL